MNLIGGLAGRMPVKAPPRDPTNSWQRQHMGETMMHRAARAPSGECFQQSTGVTKIWRDQAFRKRATDRRQDAQRSGPLALVAPEAGKTHGGAKFECSSALSMGHGKC